MLNKKSYVLVIGMSFLLTKCGDNSEKSLDCGNLCGKAKECNTNTNLEQCKESCAVTSDAFGDSTIDDLNVCSDNTCNEFQNYSSSAIIACSPGSENISKWIDGMCNSLVQCGEYTMEECQQALGPEAALLGCLNVATRDRIVVCAENANCETSMYDLEECAMEIIPLYEEIFCGFC